MTFRRVVNLVAFYAGWFACVGGAGRGHDLLGPLVAVPLVALHLGLSPQPRREALLVAAVALLGYGVDTLQTLAGVLRFPSAGAPGWLPPAWLLALWCMFATTLTVSFGWLAGRPGLAALLGAVAGPLSYAAGVRLGAAEFPHPAASAVVLAAVWAVLMPALVRLAARLAGTSATGREAAGTVPRLEPAA